MYVVTTLPNLKKKIHGRKREKNYCQFCFCSFDLRCCCNCFSHLTVSTLIILT